MVSLTLTDEQVIQLAMRLPNHRKRELAAILNENEEEPRLIDKGGVSVVHAKWIGDVEAAVEQERENRLNDLLSEANR